MNLQYLPSDSNGKSTARPISPFDERHLAAHIAPWSIKDLVGMAMVCCGVIMGMRPAVFVRMRHFELKSGFTNLKSELEK